MSKWFSNRGSSRKRQPGRRRLMAESLEARQMLAADVITNASGHTVLVGDHNHDNVVNSTDLGLLLNNYGATEDTNWETGDLNADSIVNSHDLGMLLNNFNEELLFAAGENEVAPPAPLEDDHDHNVDQDASLIELTLIDGAYYGDVFGELEEAGDVDVFQFTTDIDQPFTATLNMWHNGGTTVELLNEGGEIFVTVGAQGFFSWAEMNAQLAAGSYFLRVTGVDDAAGGYAIDLRLGTPEPPVIVDNHADEIGPDATPLQFFLEDGIAYAHPSGLLATEGDIDVFQFTTEADGQFRGVMLSLSPIPTVMELLDETGTVISEVTPEDGQVEGLIETDLSAGTYYVSFRTVTGEAGGNFFVDIQLGNPPPPPMDEHADEIGPDATALELVGFEGVLRKSIVGSLEEPGDVDVFQFEISEDLRLSGFARALPDGVGTRMDLLDESGEVVESFDINQPANFDLQLTAGLYYVSFDAGPDDVGGDYLANFQFGDFEPQPITDDHADLIGADATPIDLVDIGGGAFHGSVFGTIEEADDFDVFQFEISEDLQLTGFAHGFTFETFGPPMLMAVLDEAGEVLADYPINRPAEIDLQLTAGLYYLSFDGGSAGLAGSYFADIQLGDFVPPPPPPPISDDHADEIGPDATEMRFFEANGLLFSNTTGNLGGSDDVDVFQFTIGESAPVSGAAYTFSTASIVVDVLDEQGDLIATVSAEGEGATYFDVTLEEGVYYLAVSGEAAAGAMEGHFTVDLQVGEYELPPPPVDDHADEISGATVIELEGEEGVLFGFANGVIGTPGDYDVFQFTTETDEAFSAFVSPDWTGGGTVELLDADGLFVTSVASQNQFEGLILETDLVAGTYYLRVSGSGDALPEDWQDGRFIGPFGDAFFSPESEYFIQLKVGEIPPPPPRADDHVDAIGTAATLLNFEATPHGMDAQIEGFLDAAADIDVFQFTIDAAMPISGNVFAIGEGATTVELIDAATGEAIVELADSEGFESFEFDVILTPGTYYLSVSDGGDGEPRPYFGSLVSNSNGMDDHADVIGDEATQIRWVPDHGSLVGSGGGFIGSDTDNDVFQFDLSETQPVDISFTDFEPGTVLTLSGSFGNVIDSLDAADAAIISSELAAGTYYIAVSSESIGSFQFDLRVGAIDPDFDDHTDEIGEEATVIDTSNARADGGVFFFGSGSLEAEGDIDVFQFEVGAGSQINLFTFTETSIELLAEDGAVLESASEARAILLEIDEGLYYIRVAALEAVPTADYFFMLDILTAEE